MPHAVTDPVHEHFRSSADGYEGNRVEDYEKDYDVHTYQRGLAVARHRRSEPSEEEEKEKNDKSDDDDDEWLFNVNPSTDSPDTEPTSDSEGNKDNTTQFKWVKIEMSEEDQPVLLISSKEAIDGLQLKIPADSLQRYEKVRVYETHFSQ
ncbi:hypothetical protein COOONC_24412 [Cooperia oncophora]